MLSEILAQGLAVDRDKYFAAGFLFPGKLVLSGLDFKRFAFRRIASCQAPLLGNLRRVLLRAQFFLIQIGGRRSWGFSFSSDHRQSSSPAI
jgi:hypothetical protein